MLLRNQLRVPRRTLALLLGVALAFAGKVAASGGDEGPRDVTGLVIEARIVFRNSDSLEELIMASPRVWMVPRSWADLHVGSDCFFGPVDWKSLPNENYTAVLRIKPIRKTRHGWYTQVEVQPGYRHFEIPGRTTFRMLSDDPVRIELRPDTDGPLRGKYVDLQLLSDNYERPE